MVVEKQHPSAAKETVSMEAIRMRVLSQEWADSSVPDLMQALAKLHTLPPTIPPHDYQSQISLILVHLDRFAAAAQHAFTFNQVIAQERNEIASYITHGEQQIIKDEQEVQHLREKLQRERKQVDRRAQYDALAKLILDCPPCEKSQSQLEDAQKESKTVSEDIKHLENTKEAVRKELLLLAHCATGLEDTTNTLSALVSDHGNRVPDTQQPMDVSI